MNQEELERKFSIQSAILNKQIEQFKTTTQLNGERAYVAYMDLDGFKEKVYQDAEELYDRFSDKTKYIGNYIMGAVIESHNGEEAKAFYFDKLLRPHLFSDSYFICTVDDSLESFRQLSTITSIVLSKGLELGLTARGAISVGKTFLNPARNVLIGESVIKAASLAAAVKVFGIVIDEEINETINDYTTPFLEVSFNDETKQFRFANVDSFSPHNYFEINKEGTRTLFSELKSDYLNKNDAKEKIIERYNNSEAIINEMFK